jgi:hypothetical protein
MALGGGTFTTQNKILPGTYHNFVSKASAVSLLGERGIVAMPIALKWGNAGITTVTVEEFIEDSMKIFGYRYDAPELLEIREVFKHASKVYFYNLAYVKSGSTKSAASSSKYATAKKLGSRGNNLKLIIEQNVDDTDKFDVTLKLDTSIVHEQTVSNMSELKDNDFVTWVTTEALSVGNVDFTGGTDGSTDNDSYTSALDAFESYQFNVLLCPESQFATTYVSYTKRMRDQRGIKFQTVIPTNVGADYEGVIQIDGSQAEAAAWVAGALAGCAINQSCTNMTYDGEKSIPTTHTQRELENLIKTGVFAFHKVYDDVNVLVDINSLTTFTNEKGKDFSSNQVIRVNDQCANDTAKIFNTKYLGKIQNDDNGRISFWNDVVTHRRELENLRAIEPYDSAALVVHKGKDRFSVVLTESYTPVGAMEKLYITTEIN